MDKKRNYIPFLAFSIFVTLGLYVPLLNVIALLIALTYLFVASKEDVLPFLLFVLPFSAIFKHDLYGFAFFNIVLVFSTVKVLIFNTQEEGIESGSIPRHILVFGTVFAGYAVIVSIGRDIIGSITVVISLVLCGILISDQQNDEIHLRSYLRYFSVGIIITSLIGLFKNSFPRLIPYLSESMIKENGEYYSRFAGITGNPNHYTLPLSVVLAAYCVLIIQKKIAFADIVFIASMVIFGIMSVSKSFLISFAILIVVLLVQLTKHNRKVLIFVIFIFILCGYAIYTNQDNEVVRTIIFRLSNDVDSGDIDSISTGRTVIWRSYIEYIFDNTIRFMFGSGFGAIWVKGRASHNYFIETLHYLGFVGSILYFCVVNRFFSIRNDESKRKQIYGYIPWLVLLVRSIAINIIMNEEIAFLFVVCALSVKESQVTVGHKLGTHCRYLRNQ